MSEAIRFQHMSIEQRETVLGNLVNRLDVSASIAHHEGDPIWKMLHKLSDEIRVNQVQIAADFSDAATSVIREAAGLLARFEVGEIGKTLQ